MDDLSKRHEGIRSDPKAGILDIPTAGQKEHIRRYKAPRAVHPSPDATDNPALDFEPEQVPRPERNQKFPPILTIDGRVDTDIDHLMDDDDDGDVILASDYPKPHVFSVIQGSIDDDVDALANHDGTMEHTLVDSPKQIRSKNLQDVAAKGGRRKSPGRVAIEEPPLHSLPSPGMSRSLMPSDRSYNKQRVDFSDDEDEGFSRSLIPSDRSHNKQREEFSEDEEVGQEFTKKRDNNPTSASAAKHPPITKSGSKEFPKPSTKTTHKSNSYTPISTTDSTKSVQFHSKHTQRVRKRKTENKPDNKWIMDNIDITISNDLQIQPCDNTSNFRRVESCSSCNTVTRIDQLHCPIDGIMNKGEVTRKDNPARVQGDQAFSLKEDSCNTQKYTNTEEQKMSDEKSCVSNHKSEQKQPPPAPASSTVSNKQILNEEHQSEWLDRVRQIISDEGFGFRPPRHLLLHKSDNGKILKADSLNSIKKNVSVMSENETCLSDNTDLSTVVKPGVKEIGDLSTLHVLRKCNKKKASSCSTLSDSTSTLNENSVRESTSLNKASSISQFWTKGKRLVDSKPIECSKVIHKDISTNDISTKSLQNYLEEVSRNPKASTICDSLKAAIKVAEQSMSAAAKVAQALSLVIEATRASKSVDFSSSDSDSISQENDPLNVLTSSNLSLSQANMYSPTDNDEGQEKLYLLKEKQLLSYISRCSEIRRETDDLEFRKCHRMSSDNKKNISKSNVPVRDFHQKTNSTSTSPTYVDYTANHKNYHMKTKKNNSEQTKRSRPPGPYYRYRSRSRSPVFTKHGATLKDRYNNQRRGIYLNPHPCPDSRKSSPQKISPQKFSPQKNKRIEENKRNEAYLSTTNNHKSVSTDESSQYEKVVFLSDKATTYECSHSTQTSCSVCSNHSSERVDSEISHNSSSYEYKMSVKKNPMYTSVKKKHQISRQLPQYTNQLDIEICRINARNTPYINNSKENLNQDHCHSGASFDTSTTDTSSKQSYASPLSKYFSQLVSGFNKGSEEMREDQVWVSATKDGTCVDPIEGESDESPKSNMNVRVSQLLRKYNCSPLEFQPTCQNVEGQRKRDNVQCQSGFQLTKAMKDKEGKDPACQEMSRESKQKERSVSRQTPKSQTSSFVCKSPTKMMRRRQHSARKDVQVSPGMKTQAKQEQNVSSPINRQVRHDQKGTSPLKSPNKRIKQNNVTMNNQLVCRSPSSPDIDMGSRSPRIQLSSHPCRTWQPRQLCAANSSDMNDRTVTRSKGNY